MARIKQMCPANTRGREIAHCRALGELPIRSVKPLCNYGATPICLTRETLGRTGYVRSRPFTSRISANDSALNVPVRSISTLNVTGTLLALHDWT